MRRSFQEVEVLYPYCMVIESLCVGEGREGDDKVNRTGWNLLFRMELGAVAKSGRDLSGARTLGQS